MFVCSTISTITNLGDIVQDGDMRMVDIVVDNGGMGFFVAFFDVQANVDIGNSIVTDTVVTVPSYNEHSEAI